MPISHSMWPLSLAGIQFAVVHSSANYRRRLVHQRRSTTPISRAGLHRLVQQKAQSCTKCAKCLARVKHTSCRQQWQSRSRDRSTVRRAAADGAPLSGVFDDQRTR